MTVAGSRPRRAHRRRQAGGACGALHDALAEVVCPPGVWDAPGAECRERRLLTLDPSTRKLRHDAGWVALTGHWLEAGRLHGLSAASRTWACRFMLTDLAERHAPAELAHIRAAMRIAAPDSFR